METFGRSCSQFAQNKDKIISMKMMKPENYHRKIKSVNNRLAYSTRTDRVKNAPIVEELFRQTQTGASFKRSIYGYELVSF